MQVTGGVELLTVEEMAEADLRAVAAGVPSLALMENAGRAVADAAWKFLQKTDRVVVLCGPGNNGGDGFVAARLLAEYGCDVVVALLGERAALKGDAAEMAQRWKGEVVPLDPQVLQGAKVIVDAIFGAGLARDVDGMAARAIRVINERQNGSKVIAVDVPSGLDGNTGQERGIAVRADATVTFFRLKPGHVLLPGRNLCGPVNVADIGIPAAVLPSIGCRAQVQDDRSAAGIAAHYPWRRAADHKYAHGHAVVVSGPAFQSGAARLAARGALRIGSGLVTIASPPSALPENAAHLTAVMLKPCANAHALSDMLADRRNNAVLIGPGASVCTQTAEMVLAALGSGAAIVLDADALGSFADSSEGASNAGGAGFGFTSKTEATVQLPQVLFDAIHANRMRPVVMTPHEGEFKRLFPDLAEIPSKLERARRAAHSSGAIVVLKGADTVIASADGLAAVNANAPPTLATAGSGDVLAGFITGLLAQAMPAFEAACAAVWLHGACAAAFGPGLIAEDLPEVLPQVLRRLYTTHETGT